MPELTSPTTAVHRSFLAAMAEFRAEGRGSAADTSMVGREIRDYAATWSDPAVFGRYVEELIGDAAENAPRPEGFVPCTTRWFIEGEEYLGRLAIRHRLTPWLLEFGGHIGYDVRPTARRRGYATAMLRSALPISGGLGVDRVLVTCDTDNVGSRKAIEANGGVLEDERGTKLRYWISTG